VAIRRPIRVLISGASGLIGTELTRQLVDDGHEVLHLVRRAPRAPHEINWAPSHRTMDFRIMGEVDVVVNLSGASIARLPWTDGYRRTLRDSRVRSTQALADAMNMVATPPKVFLSASGVHVYGDRPGMRVTDESPPGTGFLPELVLAWEGAARLAPAKTRVVNLRSSVVIARDGGLFDTMRLLTKAGLGARLGTGGQHWPWISLHDEAAAIRHLMTSKLSGPVILAGPTPATSDRVTHALATQLHRPYAVRVPEGMIRMLGEGGERLALDSVKVVPVRLTDDGFRWRHPRVEDAIAAAF
jgi:uncharacterized protein (TIGR01777 family)